jgi:hypothetical protein
MMESFAETNFCFKILSCSLLKKEVFIQQLENFIVQ